VGYAGESMTSRAVESGCTVELPQEAIDHDICWCVLCPSFHNVALFEDHCRLNHGVLCITVKGENERSGSRAFRNSSLGLAVKTYGARTFHNRQRTFLRGCNAEVEKAIQGLFLA
jgi:hypothetical protein